MWAWFVFLSFETRWVDLIIHFTTPTKLLVVFRFIQAIAFYILCSLDSIGKGGMFLLPTILTLEYSWVHVCPSNRNNVPFNIEASIDKVLSLAPTLNIPNVYPNNEHIWLGENFDDSWFGSKNDIVENLILLYDIFNITRRKTNLRIIIEVIWDAYDFQIGLGL